MTEATTVTHLALREMTAAPPVATPVRPTATRLGRQVERLLRSDPFYVRHATTNLKDKSAGMVDVLFAGADEPTDPADVFQRLRWGGQFVYMSHRASKVASLAQQYHSRGGFVVDHGPAAMRKRFFGLAINPLGRRIHYFIARRVTLTPPGEASDRFTFNVRLVRRRGSDEYTVLKEIPSYGSIADRLRDRFPDASMKQVAAQARKLCDRVFPVFMTRETAFLQLLQRKLPEAYRPRVPQLLGLDKGGDGLVRRLQMNWLRVGGPRLSQFEFARQSADLLHQLHDVANLIHLDLRLDNFVITPDGVGFVDFGSAVREGEQLDQSPMLRSLFGEMMSTSQIQRTLGKMIETGRLTSDPIINAHQRVDKQVDLFYLALQMNKPHVNPELADLIEYSPESDEARMLASLTHAILKPKNPSRPSVTSAEKLLRGLDRVRKSIADQPKTRRKKARSQASD